MENKTIEIMNRSAGRVCYSIPDMHIRRDLASGESIKTTEEELNKLSYQPGGKSLIANYLLVKDSNVLNDLHISTEPEYNMTVDDVAKLLQSGTQDEFLDALDFAPDGVIDMIKNLSVSLPLMDMNKRAAILKKTGFNVDEAIRHEAEDKAIETEKGDVAPTAAPTPARRTTGSKYKVVEKK